MQAIQVKVLEWICLVVSRIFEIKSVDSTEEKFEKSQELSRKNIYIAQLTIGNIVWNGIH